MSIGRLLESCSAVGRLIGSGLSVGAGEGGSTETGGLLVAICSDCRGVASSCADRCFMVVNASAVPRPTTSVNARPMFVILVAREQPLQSAISLFLSDF